MKEEIIQAPFVGEIKIGDKKIPCAVTKEGTRLITQAGFLSAIGRTPRPKGGQGASIDEMIPFLAAKNLKPFISQELQDATIPYRIITLTVLKPTIDNSEGMVFSLTVKYVFF